MNEAATIATKKALEQMVRTLFRAENGIGSRAIGDDLSAPRDSPEETRRIADGILASDYLPIIRGKGQVDVDRNETLAKISSGPAQFVRLVATADIEVCLFLDNQVAVVRSALPTVDSRTSPPTEATYRNTHVFLCRSGEWKCVAWQVTKVQD
ncbi:MAG: hypothetical protein HZC37_04730 [Burkholderiales bacterium]|nr:hypothetical protein [Burkholderiales bacterium]